MAWPGPFVVVFGGQQAMCSDWEVVALPEEEDEVAPASPAEVALAGGQVVLAAAQPVMQHGQGQGHHHHHWTQLEPSVETGHHRTFAEPSVGIPTPSVETPMPMPTAAAPMAAAPGGNNIQAGNWLGRFAAIQLHTTHASSLFYPWTNHTPLNASHRWPPFPQAVQTERSPSDFHSQVLAAAQATYSPRLVV